LIGRKALSVIPSSICPSDLLDERGFIRPAGSVCSIGSVDPNAIAPPP
jgi:hypothetical protein